MEKAAGAARPAKGEERRRVAEKAWMQGNSARQAWGPANGAGRSDRSVGQNQLIFTSCWNCAKGRKSIGKRKESGKNGWPEAEKAAKQKEKQKKINMNYYCMMIVLVQKQLTI